MSTRSITDGQVGPEYVDGSKVRVLQWNLISGNQYAEYWSASYIFKNETLIIGNNGYTINKVASLLPENPRVPRGQRPAL